MIILEGPDGAGKTTLGKMLKQDKIVKFVLDSPNRTRNKVPLEDQTNRYRIYFCKEDVAVDRYLWSELVYGPLLRGHTVISPAMYDDLLSSMMWNHCPIVFCLPKELKTLQYNVQKQMPGVKQNIKEIFDKYEVYTEVLKKYKHFFRYDFSIPESYQKLKELISGQRKQFR